MREKTPIDEVAENYAKEFATLVPTMATDLGISGFEGKMDDFSPEGQAAINDLNRRTLAEFEGLEPADDVDRVTVAAMTDQLGLSIEWFERGEYRRDLNNIASPLQMRDVFDLMPTDTAEQWSHIAARMADTERAIDGYIETLREGIAHDQMPARRQVEAGVAEAKRHGDVDNGFFGVFAREARPDKGEPSSALASELTEGAERAAAAYRKLAAFLADELLEKAPLTDGIGRERYELASRMFVSDTVDLDETYEWGLSEVARIKQEQRVLGEQIVGPGASVADTIAALDADPAYRLEGKDALKEWMQSTADDAIARLNGTEFDIDPKLLTLEACIAPTATGGIYYTGPTDDWSRPGRMWWSVPEGVTSFTTWREKTTVFHEGVPGHHLQVGTAVANADDLNLWRRQLSWTSGYGEGWALYAEQLMADLGFMDDLGDRFGLLDSQLLRATRVVFDIGVHLGKPAITEYGDGPWNAESAWRMLHDNIASDEQTLRFEWLRYLGWPGQAPSYSIGARLWTQYRDDAAKFGKSAKQFHDETLRQGAVPLSVLRSIV